MRISVVYMILTCNFVIVQRRCQWGAVDQVDVEGDGVDFQGHMRNKGCGKLQPRFSQEGAQIFVTFPDEANAGGDGAD